jgi:hypothetical protein
MLIRKALISPCTVLLLVIPLLLTTCQEAPSSPEESPEAPEMEAAAPQPLDMVALETALGKAGSRNNGEFKVTVPQNDLNVIVDGFRIIPPMGLGSWAAFSPAPEGAMLMGDIVVGESEISPVQQTVIEQGLSITAIHNHFVRNQPHYMYMHIGGMGPQEQLARGVKAIFDKVAELRGDEPSATQAPSVSSSLDTTRIAAILGHSGSLNNGVYKVTIGRPDIDLREHGVPVSTFMGFNTWAAWQGSPEKAAVGGDFTMLAEEVEPVIRALVENGIEVVALHNHMVHEQPRIFFLHYWGVGPAEDLARGLRAALDQTGSGENG